MENISPPSSSQLYPLDLASTTIKETLAEVIRSFQLAVEPSDGETAAENVHALRVSIRRSLNALDIFRDFLPRRSARKLERNLRKLRKAAGVARDMDVVIERIKPELQEANQHLAQHLRDMSLASRADLKLLYETWEKGERIERLATKILCGVRPRRAEAEHLLEPLDKFVRRRLRFVQREFFNGVEIATRNSTRLHAFRLRAKKLRDWLELLSPGLPAGTCHEAIKTTKKLSQRLGEINDHATAEILLCGWRQGLGERSAARALKRICKSERESLQQSLDSFSRWWSKRRLKRLRRYCKQTTGAVSKQAAKRYNGADSQQRGRPAK